MGSGTVAGCCMQLCISVKVGGMCHVPHAPLDACSQLDNSHAWHAGFGCRLPPCIPYINHVHLLCKLFCSRVADVYDVLQLLGLYRLHLQYGPVPPEFSKLLQLREMLDISDKEGEALEREVLESGSAFSI